MHRGEKGETEIVQRQAVSKGHNICWKEIFQQRSSDPFFLKELCLEK